MIETISTRSTGRSGRGVLSLVTGPGLVAGKF